MEMQTGRGRIYRLRHEGFERGPQPRMLDETPAQWVQHLSHPNGWWRDTAQKLLVLRRDRSVVPALVKLATSDAADARPRLHALWTLEGLG
ncbi:MAG: Cytochrome c, partial [Steroidobacteraceae bacterium]|nr:Cytochrome c [Steroidobacteraceae bacterium]